MATAKRKKLTGMGDRLRVRREDIKLLQKDVGIAMGVSAGTIGAWEREEAAPGGENLLALSEVLKVEAGWIITGDTSKPLPNVVSSSSEVQHIPRISMNEIDHNFGIKTLRSKTIRLEPTLLPVGEDAFNTDVIGDSMINPHGYPSMPEGTVITIDPSLEAKNGYFILVVTQDGSALFKKYIREGENAWLVSLNPDYPRITFSNDMRIIGVVRGTYCDLIP